MSSLQAAAPTLLPSSALTSSQVLQRGADGVARVRLETDVVVHGTRRGPQHHSPGDVLELPTGGPYRLEGAAGSVGDLLVGDVWLLAGQSNMQGAAPSAEAEPAPLARSRGLDGCWGPARDPLHRLYAQRDGVHLAVHRHVSFAADPGAFDAQVDDWVAADARSPIGGTGPGLAFATSLTERTGVPVGLVACALTATGLEHWEPGWSQRNGGLPDRDLYAFLLAALTSTSPVGMLWYQGESDTTTDLAAGYAERFERWLATLRGDSGRPDLAVVTVQLGPVDEARLRTVTDEYTGRGGAWAAVREAQRRVAAAVPRVRMVSAGDLQVHDGIHLDAPSVQRLGRRMAHAAALLTDGSEQPGLDIDSVHVSVNRRVLRLRFRGVSGRLRQHGPPAFRVWDAMGRPGPSVTDVLLAERDAALLPLSAALPAGAALSHAMQWDDRPSLADSADCPVPAFGPVRIDDPDGGSCGSG